MAALELKPCDVSRRPSLVETAAKEISITSPALAAALRLSLELPDMIRAQRIVLILYCLLLAYCYVWVPWRTPVRSRDRYERAGYGWLWAGPYRSATVVYDPPVDVGKGYRMVEEEDARPPAPNAEPDLPLMGIRFLAISAISAAAFLIAGLWKSSATRN
jgi:hypothetical protein